MDEMIGNDVFKIVQAVSLGSLAGKTILVTGASGLLGTYIASTLSEIGGRYRLDLYLQSRTKLKLPGDTPNYRNVIADLSNEADCRRLPNADVIICAHSYAQPLRFIAEPLASMRASGYGLMALLEKCNVGGRFMFISSSEVYCDSPHQPPFLEDRCGIAAPYHPRACYIMAKQWGEALTYLYRQRGISTVSVRPGITYGPGFRQGDRRSWAEFIQRAFEAKFIRLRDAGEVRRTMCYISDGIEMLFRLLLYGTQSVYNLGGGSTHSVAEIAKTIGEHTGATVFVPTENNGVAGTPDNLALSMSRYNHEFGAMNYIPLDEGMQRTAEWYQSEYVQPRD